MSSTPSASKEIRDNPGKIPDLGSEGVWAAIFIVNVKKRVAQKLRRILLLHFGNGSTRKPIFVMIFGVLDVSMTPKSNYF